MARTLSKSRFKEALDCMTSLYYTGKKDEYADTNLDDPFLQALAKGGFQVGELAKYYFTEDPIIDDITIDTLNMNDAIEETQRRLSLPGRVVIAEAAFIYENLFIRADIVVKEGNTLCLYEVKAKSMNDNNTDWESFLNKKGTSVCSEWVPYVYDVAFQKYVVSNCHYASHFEIRAHLMMANKSKMSTINGLNQHFKIINQPDGRYKVVTTPGIKKSDLGNDILTPVNLDPLIERVWNEFTVPTDYANNILFEEFINKSAELYTSNRREFTPISNKCKSCRYINTDSNNGLKSGFHECWQQHTKYSRELLDKSLAIELWGGKSGASSPAKKLIDHGQYLLENANVEIIKPKGGGAVENGLSAFERRKLQIDKVREGDETSYIDREGLRNEMSLWKYPLHMIDFETSMVALPFHKGQKPYQGIAFQFSHHVMHQDGRIEHAGEFLCSTPGEYPNFEFIRELKRQLEIDHGSIFRYHNHENTYLNMIAIQLDEYGDGLPDKDELIAFIRSITQQKNQLGAYEVGPRNMIDLYELVIKYYYSPLAKGSNSLKQILPAIIQESDYLQNKYSRKGVYGKNLPCKSLNFDDHIWIDTAYGMDPYKTLPPVFNNYNREQLDELVREFDEVGDGGAALTAYNFLQFSNVPAEQRMLIADALKRYCELDTLAMIMIVEGWKSMINN